MTSRVDLDAPEHSMLGRMGTQGAGSIGGIEMTSKAKKKKSKFREEAPSGIRLTPKGLGLVDGQRHCSRFCLRNTETKQCVYVYGTDEAAAISTGAMHFRVGPSKIAVEHAGHIEWNVLDKGGPNERAVQVTVWAPGHDVGEVIDDSPSFSHLKKKEVINESDSQRVEHAAGLTLSDGGEAPAGSPKQDTGGEPYQRAFGKEVGDRKSKDKAPPATGAGGT